MLLTFNYSCVNCPFMKDYVGGAIGERHKHNGCSLEEGKFVDWQEPIPDWCKLRKGDVLVRLGVDSVTQIPIGEPEPPASILEDPPTKEGMTQEDKNKAADYLQGYVECWLIGEHNVAEDDKELVEVRRLIGLLRGSDT